QGGDKFGLAGQDDLQQLFLSAFEVAEQAQQFQAGHVQVLRVVDHQHAGAAVVPAAEQEAVERVQVGGGVGTGLDPEVAADRRQQVGSLEEGVEQQRDDRAAILDFIQQPAQEGALAGAHVAGQQHESLAREHAVHGFRQFALDRAGAEIVLRIRGGRERRPLQAEALQIGARGGGVGRAHLRLASTRAMASSTARELPSAWRRCCRRWRALAAWPWAASRMARLITAVWSLGTRSTMERYSDSALAVSP